MTKTSFFAALPLILSLTVSATSQELPREAGGQAVGGTHQFVVHGTDKPIAPRFQAARFRDHVDDRFTSIHLE
jgi:hypothetical protein